MPKVTQFDRQKIVTDKVVLKELLAENLAYLSIVCSVSLKHLKKLDKWRTNEDEAGLKITDEQHLKEKKRPGTGPEKCIWSFS